MDTNIINLDGSKTLIKYAKLRPFKNVKQHGNKIISKSISEIFSFIYIYIHKHIKVIMTYIKYIRQSFLWFITLLRFFSSSLLFPHIFRLILHINNINTVYLHQPIRFYMLTTNYFCKIMAAWYFIVEIYHNLSNHVPIEFLNYFSAYTILQYKSLSYISLWPIFIIIKIDESIFLSVQYTHLDCFPNRLFLI